MKLHPNGINSFPLPRFYCEVHHFFTTRS